jgi:hypothetical protein
MSASADDTSKQFPGGAAFWSLPMQELEYPIGGAATVLPTFRRKNDLAKFASAPMEQHGR